jgi:hypothetical protein
MVHQRMKHQPLLAPICSVTCPNSIHMSFFLYSCSRPRLDNPAGSLRRHAELMRSLLGPLAGDPPWGKEHGPASPTPMTGRLRTKQIISADWLGAGICNSVLPSKWNLILSQRGSGWRQGGLCGEPTLFSAVLYTSPLRAPASGWYERLLGRVPCSVNSLSGAYAS